LEIKVVDNIVCIIIATSALLLWALFNREKIPDLSKCGQREQISTPENRKLSFGYSSPDFPLFWNFKKTVPFLI